MCNQLAGTFDATTPAKLWVIDQVAGFGFKNLIKG